MYLTPEEIRLILKMIRTLENTQGTLSPEMVVLNDKIRYEFGL
jgi:hypothetical protein